MRLHEGAFKEIFFDPKYGSVMTSQGICPSEIEYL